MGPLVGATAQALIDAGNNLLKPLLPSTDVTLSLLDEIESLLSTVEQDPSASVQDALLPSSQALVSPNLLRNPDSDVRVFVVSCLTEIMRITAPEAPYNDDQMKEIFKATIEAFQKLSDASCRSYRKAEAVLETVSKVRSSLVMLDLECDDLILEMFQQFLKVISPEHPQTVLLSMEAIMITVIDESEEISMDLLEILLTAVRKESSDVSPTASRLVERVLSSCAHRLQPCIMEALKLKGTSLDLYSPVVSSICQSESATTQAHNVVNAKENELLQKIEVLSERQVVPSDLLEDKLDLGVSRKGNRSKRTARSSIHRANENDKATSGNNLKQGQSESTDAEADSGSMRKRGRKPNSLMNPDEGYAFKTASSKKKQEKDFEGSSLLTKVGQMNKSGVISLSSSAKAGTGSRKRIRTKTNNDVGSVATPSSKKKIKKIDNSEGEIMEAKVDEPEGGTETAKSKEGAENGSAKTSAKKPLAEVKTSGKKSVHSDAKKKNSGGAIVYAPTPGSSKLKKKNSSGMTPSSEKSEQTPKSHTKRKRTAEDNEFNMNWLGKELVGKKVNVWWPLDEVFYEGVIVSYISRTKKHQVLYSDGDSETVDLKKERFEIIQDHSPASEGNEVDLPETVPLSELIKRQKIKKRKKMSTNVEPSNSPEEVRSITRTKKKKDSVTDSIKQVDSTEVAVKDVSDEPENKDEKNLKSSNKVNGEAGRTKGRSGKNKKVTRGKHSKGKKLGAKLGKADVETDCIGEHQELHETETDGEVQKSAEEPSAVDCETGVKARDSLEEKNAEPRTDGEVQKSVEEPSVVECETDAKERDSLEELIAEAETGAAKEPAAEAKTDEEEHKTAEETNAEPETDEKEQKSLKGTNVEPKAEGEEGKSEKEPPETKVEEKESTKENTAQTKVAEIEDMCEAKGQEIEKETSMSLPESGKVENEAEANKEESDKAEAVTVPVSG